MIMTWTEWEVKYKPTTDIEYGDLTEIDDDVDQHYIWTVIDGEGIYMNITSGIHIINRLGYFVTEVPWTEDVFVSNDRQYHV